MFYPPYTGVWSCLFSVFFLDASRVFVKPLFNILLNHRSFPLYVLRRSSLLSVLCLFLSSFLLLFLSLSLLSSSLFISLSFLPSSSSLSTVIECCAPLPSLSACGEGLCVDRDFSQHVYVSLLILSSDQQLYENPSSSFSPCIDFLLFRWNI